MTALFRRNRLRAQPAAALAIAAAAMTLTCASTPALAQNGGVTTGYLTGVWKEDQQCRGNEAMVFFPNDTMSSAGSVAVSYAVTGPSQIVMHGPGGVVPINIQTIHQNNMIVSFQGGRTVLFRCGYTSGQNFYPGPNYNPGPHYTGVLSPAYVTGGWGQNGNCARPEVFLVNGQLNSSNGDQGSWTLFGNVLRIKGVTGTDTDFAVQTNGPRNMTLTQTQTGAVSIYTRCF